MNARAGNPALAEGVMEAVARAVPAFAGLESLARKPGIKKPDRDEERGLTPIAKLILRSDARASGRDEAEESANKEYGRKRLAIQLGCSLGALQDIVDSYAERWDEFLLEERVQAQIESVESRDISWDSLEYVCLKKLTRLVNEDKVTSANEIAAIAKLANSANRGERKGTGHGQVGGITVNQQNNNYLAGNPEAGILPSGDLGRINLNLAPRFVKQIEGQIAHGDSKRVLDSVDMLSVKEIQAAGDAFEVEGVAAMEAEQEGSEEI